MYTINLQKRGRLGCGRDTSPYMKIGRYIFTEDLNKNNAKPSELAQTAKLRNIPT